MHKQERPPRSGQQGVMKESRRIIIRRFQNLQQSHKTIQKAGVKRYQDRIKMTGKEQWMKSTTRYYKMRRGRSCLRRKIGTLSPVNRSLRRKKTKTADQAGTKLGSSHAASLKSSVQIMTRISRPS